MFWNQNLTRFWQSLSQRSSRKVGLHVSWCTTHRDILFLTSYQHVCFPIGFFQYLFPCQLTYISANMVFVGWREKSAFCINVWVPKWNIHRIMIMQYKGTCFTFSFLYVLCSWTVWRFTVYAFSMQSCINARAFASFCLLYFSSE